MKQQMKAVPVAGMNKDVPPDLLSEGQYIDALNVESGYGETPGVMVNEKGMLEVDPGDTGLTFLGAVSNDRTRKIYIFANVSAAEDIIYEYDLDTNTTRKIAESDVLELETRQIDGHVIDDRFLIFTSSTMTADGASYGGAPKVLDIQWAGRRQRSYNIHFDTDAFQDGTVYSIEIQDNDGNTLDSDTLLTASGITSNEDGIEQLIAAIEAFDSGSSSVIMTVTKCECGIKISITNNDRVLIISSTGSDVLTVPDNHFTELTQRHIDLIKHPPRFEPVPCYEADTSRDDNNVNDVAFQFRHQYVYWDDTYSAWGPISDVPKNINYEGVVDEELNAIRVDITADELGTAEGRNCIRSVRIAFREGNSGDFKLIDTYDVSCFGLTNQSILFYNDKLYTTVPSDENGSTGDTQVLKLFDNVPIASSTCAVISDEDGNTRLALGGNLEGYDSECSVDADIETISNPGGGSVDIVGTIEVAKTTDQDDGTTNFRYRNNQALPLGGFIVFLAGTSYYGISNCFTDGEDNSFEIKNVPPGRYILRVADFRCGFDDTWGEIYNLNRGLDWQLTSAPVTQIGGVGVQEVIIDIRAETGTYDLDLEGVGPITVADFYTGSGAAYLIEGYMRDNLGQDDSNIRRKTAYGIEQQQVEFDAIINTTTTPRTVPITAVGDHNGYFFDVGEFAANDTGLERIENLVVKAQNACSIVTPLPTTTANWYQCDTDGVFKALEDNTEGSAVTSITPAADEIIALVMMTGVPRAVNSTTFLTGQVVNDNGIGQNNVVVAFTGTGRTATTDINGEYSIRIYLPAGTSDSRTDDVVLCFPSDPTYAYPITPIPQQETIEFCTYNVGGEYPAATGTITGFTGTSSVKEAYFKSGGVYDLAIVYEDRANRKSKAFVAGEHRVAFHTEVGEYGPKGIRMTIKSQAPNWATHYRIVRTQDGIYREYLQWVLDDVQYVDIDDVDATPEASSFAASSHVLLKLNNNVTDVEPNAVNFFFKDSEYLSFIPEEGDRVRFILDENTDILPTGLYDYEIVGTYVSGSNYFLVIENAQEQEIATGALVEFYRPKRIDERTYYETATTFEVYQDGTDYYHRGSEQDQTDAQHAIVDLNGGDVYWRKRSFVVDDTTQFSVRTENNFLNDLSASALADGIGRPSPAGSDKQKFLWWQIRVSDVYTPASRINGLGNFRSLEYQNLDVTYGAITRLIMNGDVLLAVCEKKVQPIYVSKDEVLSLTGEGLLGRTDNLLNIGPEVRLDLGSRWKNSIVKCDGRVYGFDSIMGTPWQFSQAGLEPINQGMVNYFHDMGVAIEADLGNRWIVAGYNPRVKNYILSSMTTRSVSGTTIVYKPEIQAWHSRKSYSSYAYAWSGLSLLSFFDSKIYLHDSSAADRCLFHGTQYNATVRVVLNDNPHLVKFFWFTRLTGDLWVATYIETDHENWSPSIMTSRLLSGRWKRLHGNYYAEFLRAMNDPNFDDEDVALFRGEKLRGRYIIMELSSSSATTLRQLRGIDVAYAPALDTMP